MEDYPKTITEFKKRFATEEACHQYLFKIRWPAGFCCPNCSNNKAWETNRGLYRCTQCDSQISVTGGTIFHDTRKPLRLWFEVIWHITNQKYGANALGLQRIIGFGSYRTAWQWLHKLRIAMVRPDRERLSGLVEVDETYVGGEKKKGKRGRGAAYKTLVVIAVEDKGINTGGFGRIRLGCVDDASNSSLTKFIQENIEPGSTIRTDGWTAYSDLPLKGYNHIVARKSGNIGENILPLVNRIAALLKRWLLGTYQGAVRPSHLDYYLDEYTFRFNRRKSSSRGKLFYRLLQQAVIVEPVSGKDIRGGNTKTEGVEWLSDDLV